MTVRHMLIDSITTVASGTPKQQKDQTDKLF